MKRLIILIIFMIVISGFGQEGIKTMPMDSLISTFEIEPDTFTFTYHKIFFDSVKVKKWFGNDVFNRPQGWQPFGWGTLRLNKLEIPFAFWDSTWIITDYCTQHGWSEKQWSDTLKWNERLGYQKADKFPVYLDFIKDFKVRELTNASTPTIPYHLEKDSIIIDKAGDYKYSNGKLIYLGDAADMYNLLWRNVEIIHSRCWQIKYYWNLKESCFEVYKITVNTKGDTTFKRIEKWHVQN